jgi:hypothetical protein
VVARLERDVQRLAARLVARGFERRNFAVIEAGRFVEALAEHVAVRVRHDGADVRVGRRVALFSQRERPTHELLVEILGHG